MTPNEKLEERLTEALKWKSSQQGGAEGTIRVLRQFLSFADKLWIVELVEKARSIHAKET